MKKEHLIIGSGAILFLAIIAYFLIEKRKREDELLESQDRERKLGNENKALRNIVSDLKEEVNEIIDKKDELPEDVKKQLKSLIDEYKDIDEKVTNELLSVTALIEIKENTKAIMGLAKIIENLLKRIYKGDNKLKSNPRFVDLIEHAKKEKLIEKDEYHFLNGVREIRNEEAHNLSVQKGINIVSTSMLIGVSIIFKLAGIIKGI
jgi:myosin heavy subunit